MIELFNELYDVFIQAYNTLPHYFLSLMLYSSSAIVALLPFFISIFYYKKLEFIRILFFIYCILVPIYIYVVFSNIFKEDFTSLGYYLSGIVGLFLWSTDCFLLRYIISKFKLDDEIIIKKYKQEAGQLFKENNLLKLRNNYLESKIKRLEK